MKHLILALLMCFSLFGISLAEQTALEVQKPSLMKTTESFQFENHEIVNISLLSVDRCGVGKDLSFLDINLTRLELRSMEDDYGATKVSRYLMKP